MAKRLKQTYQQEPRQEEEPREKHHEPQHLSRVEVIRVRVLRMMQRDLMSLRSFLAAMGGNQRVVESLRGKSGDEILARCADYVMQELGDNSTARDWYGNSGATRMLARRVKGCMGPEKPTSEVEG